MQSKKLKNFSIRIKPFVFLKIKEEKKMKHTENRRSKLDDLKKDPPFKVPENYFDDFPVKMAHLISETNHKKQFILSWSTVRPKLIPILLVSGIAFLVVLSTLLIRTQNKQEISASELVEIYHNTALNETSETDLINELASVSNVSEFQNDTTLKTNEKYTKEAIDYLKKENVDVNSLIEAL
jgi:hypothetical protein